MDHRCEQTNKAYKCTFVFCLYTHVCTISKDISVNKEKEIYQPNKKSIGGHRCERTNMAAKCEIFMNCSKNFIGICKKRKYDC